jgi:hypothetical protein
VKTGLAVALSALVVSATQLVWAQSGGLTVPKTVEAGSAFSIPSTGSGKATLFIIGPSQVLKSEVNLGETISFPAGTLYNAGRYIAVLSGTSVGEGSAFDVVPASKATDVAFLAKPSRLPVGLHDAITGAVYVFDTYKNLILTPTPVSFELTTPSGAVQKHSVPSKYGAAWTTMDSTGQKGNDTFVAGVGSVSSSRIIGQVPGDPCGLKMNAKQAGDKVALSTDPIRDCSGNAVPDGTVVTFTQVYHGGQATVDVPVKRGIAEVQMPIHNGATISVASGVVMGNQIGWGR